MNEDYNVELRINEPVNPETISALQRAMLVRNMLKKAKGDSSTLKMFLDASSSNSFRNVSRAALADTLRMVDGKVDVVVKESIEHYGVMALLSATGKRFMYDGASLSLGPIGDGAPYMRNDDHQIRREFNAEYTRDLEYLIMSRTGVSDRSKVFWDDLNSARNFNSIQALHYGTKGLVDAVLVGFDQVVVREDLEKYLKKRRFTEAETESFLADHLNIKKLPTRNLKDFSPESIPQPDADSKIPEVSLYVSPKELQAEKKKKDAEIEKAKKEATNKGVPYVEKEDTNLAFYVPGADGSFSKVPAEKLPLVARIKHKEIKAGRVFIDNLQANRSFLEDDVIFFNEGFVDETAEQITDALAALDKKKRGQTDPSNIKIFVNSPGGSIASGLDIRSTIAHAKTPVDVIVNGMAASCGAFLVSSATGNRLMTPNARIMIHDAWWSRPMESTRHYHEAMDQLDQISRAFVKAISDASGRPFKAVWEDMKVDVWLNPLESMFYGKNGLADAILVGENKVITKQDVLDYLSENAYIKDNFGKKDPVGRYIQERNKTFRSGKRDWKPETHNNLDPFENPLQTIEAIAARAAKPLNSVPKLSGSVPRADQPVDHYVVTLPKSAGRQSAITQESAKILDFVQQRVEGTLIPDKRKDGIF